MVEKLLGKARLTRNNWWTAYKDAWNVKGHAYYKMPDMIKYRYPAPGSAALDRVDHPNLFKKHWKTPFRDSVFNIRPKEKYPNREEVAVKMVSSSVALDPENS